MSRKTVKVIELVEKANRMLANSNDDRKDQRKGIASFIESVLFEADQYAGFGYIDGWGPYEDETRRIYYFKGSK